MRRVASPRSPWPLFAGALAALARAAACDGEAPASDADGAGGAGPGRDVAIGGGHDLSVAWFVDRARDDVRAGDLVRRRQRGRAGLFVDLAGADRYDATNGRSFGWAGIDRPGEDVGRMMSGTVGVFLEADGVDTYVRPELGDVANDATWRQARNGPSEGELGVGLDRPGGRAGR